jgi:hypothetical protein
MMMFDKKIEDHKIIFVVTSYKDKNFIDFLKHTHDVTHRHSHFEVYESNPIIHDLEINKLDFHVAYDYKIWDSIESPVSKKTQRLEWLARDNRNEDDVICFITPDTILSKDWYVDVIKFLKENPNSVISGNGKAKVGQKDYFSYQINFEESDQWEKNQIITKHFMVGFSGTFKSIKGPGYLKYNGEDEAWTLELLSNNIDIYSAPSSLYIDTKNRSMETTYKTWSSDHNYNVVVDLIKGNNLDKYNVTEEGLEKFLSAHSSIKPDELYPLPYSTNDVDYDPYNLKMHEVDARRFIAGVKAIY